MVNRTSYKLKCFTLSEVDPPEHSSSSDVIPILILGNKIVEIQQIWILNQLVKKVI